METQIKIGDTVKTKENNRPMGVNNIIDGQAECVYHKDDGVPYTEIHPLNNLVLFSS
jgi:hypothetical protein